MRSSLGSAFIIEIQIDLHRYFGCYLAVREWSILWNIQQLISVLDLQLASRHNGAASIQRLFNYRNWNSRINGPIETILESLALLDLAPPR